MYGSLANVSLIELHLLLVLLNAFFPNPIISRLTATIVWIDYHAQKLLIVLKPRLHSTKVLLLFFNKLQCGKRTK